MDNSVNSKRIAKNTFYLYFRMMFLMFITFFTSRVVLDKLGVEDFGIQNVVGGLASMFTFFRSSMANATQRFLSLTLAKGDATAVRNIFSQHQTLYIVITIAIVVIAEFCGLWFLNNKLSIPGERMNAAFWVFQFTVISLIATMLTIAYDSVLIAREDMKVYSYVGIVEGLAKLGIAYIISVVSSDRLIVYSGLLAMVSYGVFFYYVWYCSRHYDEARYKFVWERQSIRETFSFISWNVVGTAVYAINDQGINILLNMFFGPVINAARGIAFQVSQALNHFSANFYTAVRPQIMKSYATGDKEYLFKLLYSSSKYSVYLLWYLSLPVILCIDAILSVWLTEVPEFSNVFTVWILLYALVNSLSNPIWTLALAIGELKWYISIGSGVFLLTFPVSYIVLVEGMSPVSVFVVSFVVRSIYIVVVLLIVQRYIFFSLSEYFLEVLLPSSLVVVLSGAICYYIKTYIQDSFMGIIEMTILTTVVISACVWLIGINQAERNKLKTFVVNKITSK